MEQPDFEALARAWVEGDPRLQEVVRRDPERAEAMVARMAAALERRRREVAPPPEAPRGDLVVNVHPSRLDPRTGLDPEALDQLAGFVEEAAGAAAPDSEEEG